MPALPIPPISSIKPTISYFKLATLKKIFATTFIFLVCSASSFSQTTVQEAQKIATFCKFWGFLKYYHPSVASGKTDWDKEFTSRIKVVSLLKSKQEINCYYSEWINGLGRVKNGKKHKEDTANMLLFNLDLAWLSDSNLFTNHLMNQLQFILQNRNRGKNFYVNQFFLSGNTTYKNEKQYPQLRNFYFAIFNGETDSVKATFERDGVILEKTLYRY
ncbi:MAG: hypothetical protein SGJ00_03120 [bacterium]|nr:hypothetical protein [bacterium]